jgi:WD40 repeat protein/serine/threonine protein kinase
LQLGLLPLDRLDAVTEHVETCPRCDARVQEFDGVTDPLLAGLRQPLPADTVPSGGWAGSSQTDVAAVPGYVLLDCLGRGAMGVVYKALQVSLNRLVALKMLPPERFPHADDLARLRREAETLAQLQHPNIVQVYETGEHRGRPYVALEFVEGGSLDQHLDGKPQPHRAAAALVQTLARAIHAAHQRGIIHRDLKPANILLVNGGVVSGDWSGKNVPATTHHPPLTTHPSPTEPFTAHQPKITDFGLAKQLDAGNSLTASGFIAGTPSYMAPEQTQAGGPVGPAADIYALGVILYEMLVGRPPFVAAAVLETLAQVQGMEPVPPRRLQPGVPRDLETICLKCLEKDAARRYASALDLAADLRRFQAGEPIVARPVRWPTRVLKWVKRRPSQAALLGVALVTAVVAFALVTWQWHEALSQKDRADARAHDAQVAQTEADRQKTLADRRAVQAQQAQQAAEQARADLQVQLAQAEAARHALQIGAAHRDLRAGFVLRAEETLAACQEPWCSWEYHYLSGWLNRQMTLLHEPGPDLLRDVAMSADGRWLAVAGPRRSVLLWDRSKSGGLATAHDDDVTAVALTPDGSRLATAGGNSVRVWDRASLKVIADFPLRGALNSLRFRDDGRWLALGHNNGMVVWDVDKQSVVLRVPGASAVKYVAFRPGSHELAAGDDGGTVRVWQPPNAKALRQWKAHDGAVHAVAFAADGSRLATGGSDKMVRLWDPDTGAKRGTLAGHPNIVTSVVFFPDSKRLASADIEGGVRLWEAEGEGEQTPPPRALIGHVRHVRLALGGSAEPGHGGPLLASAGYDGRVRLWDLTPWQPLELWTGPRVSVYSIAFSGDGRLLAAGDDEGIQLWDAETGALLHKLRGHEHAVNAVAFAPRGTLLASAGMDRTVRLWDAVTGQLVWTRGDHQKPVSCMALVDGGAKVVSGGQDGTVRLWDAATGRPLHVFPGHTAAVTSIAPTPGGKRLVTVSQKEAKLWDLDKLAELPLADPAKASGTVLVFSPDGTRLFVGTTERVIKVCDAATGKLERTLTGHDDQVWALALTPDGKRLVSASFDKTVRLWDCATGQLLLTLDAPDRLTSVAMSPDGRTLAAGSDDQKVVVWKIPRQ